MTNTRATRRDMPVLIVGGGPAGLVTAIELARHGVRSLLIEKHAGTSIYPRANAVRMRSMEIFRSWGIEAAVRAKSIDAEPLISLQPALTSTDVTEIQAGSPLRHEALQVSPTWTATISQSLLEPVLVEYARSLGAELRFSCELTGIHEDSDGLVCTARDLLSGEELSIHARFVVGCDGTRSMARAAAGIRFEGDADLGRWSTVLFQADLARRLTRRLALLYSITGLERETLFALIDDSDNWLFAVKLDTGDSGLETLADEVLLALIRRTAGVPNLKVNVRSKHTFHLGAQVAERFRGGNVLLAGDAAHRMTPQGGLGLNTAIQDAHNLAWKLAYVLKGWAGEQLLDTYEVERRPIGLRNTRISAGDEPDRRVDGLDIDIGYQYKSSAIWKEIEEPTDFPSGKPGMRLPHFWCETDGRWSSSLDIAAGPQFTLLTSSATQVWREAAGILQRHANLPIAACLIESGVTPDGRDWRHACGIGEDGAVLVRPDGFVAWRCSTLPPDTDDQLAQVLGAVLSAGTACVMRA